MVGSMQAPAKRPTQERVISAARCAIENNVIMGGKLELGAWLNGTGHETALPGQQGGPDDLYGCSVVMSTCLLIIYQDTDWVLQTSGIFSPENLFGPGRRWWNRAQVLRPSSCAQALHRDPAVPKETSDN